MEGGPIAEQPLELIRSMFEVNVFGALELAQGFIKNLLLKIWQNCIHLIDGRLMDCSLCCGILCSKHALEAIAEGLKTELEPFGIKVATCNPEYLVQDLTTVV